MGRHSAPRTPEPLMCPKAQPAACHRAPRTARPLWSRSPALPAAVIVLAVWGGAETLQLGGGISHAAAVRSSAAGVDLSALASGDQAGLLAAGGQRVSRQSRSMGTVQSGDASKTASPARPSLPEVNPGKTVPGTWVRPSAGGESSCFCVRWGVLHDGIDMAGPMNSPILAVGDGVVVQAGSAAGFGLWVVIRHDNGDYSVYGHMYHYFVTVGEHVSAGQHIADIGSNGESTGPHLHFGVMHGKLNGPYLDPVPWLRARGIQVSPYNRDA